MRAMFCADVSRPPNKHSQTLIWRVFLEIEYKIYEIFYLFIFIVMAKEFVVGGLAAMTGIEYHFRFASLIDPEFISISSIMCHTSY